MSSFDKRLSALLAEGRDAAAWLVFLMERQPHKRLELMHRKNQLKGSSKQKRIAMDRLKELVEQYPQDYLVFKTQRRLLGKQ
jgi:hypothetical protein